jgi:hypothetical protein
VAVGDDCVYARSIRLFAEADALEPNSGFLRERDASDARPEQGDRGAVQRLAK